MKGYFKAIILFIKTYENILKFNFVMGRGRRGGIRHTDCLRKLFKSSFIEIKNDEVYGNL